MIQMLCTILLLSFASSITPAHASSVEVNANAKLFGTRPFTREMSISPDGKHFALILEKGEIQRLRIINAESGKITKEINFDDSWRFGSLYWVNNERVLVAPNYQPGMTNLIFATGALYAVNVDGSKEKFLLGGNAGPQTGSIAGKRTKRISALVLDTFEQDRKKVVVELFDRGSKRPSTALLNVYTGKLSQRSYGPAVQFCRFALDRRRGHARFCVSNDKAVDHYQMFYREKSGKKWQMVSEGEVWDEEVSVHGQLKNGDFLASMPNPETSITSLYAISVRDGVLNKKLIYTNPVYDLLRVYGSSFRGFTRALYADPKPSYVYFGENQAIEDAHRSMVAAFPDHFISFNSITSDDRMALVQVASDQEPRRYYLLDIPSKKVKMVDNSYAALTGLTTTMEPVEFPARDGTPLHGHLSRTNSAEDKGLVMLIHGGPHGPFDIWGYRAEIQFLTSIGLNVMQVNFRGSGGYGLDFMRAGYGEWGRKMQDDVTDATKWAIDKGIAEPSKVCIYGGSYGAYAALAGAAFEPDLYQCAAGHVGVYDLNELRESGDIPERKSGVRYLNRVIGNDKEDLSSRSPTDFAANIKIPILLTAGLDDQRAPPIQTELMEKALKGAGKQKVTVLYQPREGHGFVSEAAEINRLEQLGNFFLSALGK